jgi:hypothetical protein
MAAKPSSKRAAAKKPAAKETAKKKKAQKKAEKLVASMQIINRRKHKLEILHKQECGRGAVPPPGGWKKHEKE